MYVVRKLFELWISAAIIRKNIELEKLKKEDLVVLN